MSTTSNTTDARVRVLADGSQIPRLGLGVWQVPKRVATAIGEGSMAVRLVFDRLQATGIALVEPVRTSAV